MTQDDLSIIISVAAVIVSVAAAAYRIGRNQR
jgi:hypothetical protein